MKMMQTTGKHALPYSEREMSKAQCICAMGLKQECPQNEQLYAAFFSKHRAVPVQPKPGKHRREVNSPVHPMRLGEPGTYNTGGGDW